MAHDKVSAAARKRMAETGEPYAAARRAVLAGHQADSGRPPTPRAGYGLRMSGEIRDWLAGLRDSEPATARAVGQALAALVNEGARLGEPLVVSTADSWAPALAEALDRSYKERLTRLTALRRGAADAASLLQDLRKQAADLESAQAKLQDVHRRLLKAGQTEAAAQAAVKLAAARQQAAEVRRLLPGAAEASQRLMEECLQRDALISAFRTRKEILKATYTAAHYSLLITAQSGLLTEEAAESVDLAGDRGDLRQDDRDETATTADARLLRDIVAQLEEELGQQAWPHGLLELRPGGLDDTRVRILFAVEPAGTALLIAVLDGPGAVRDQYLEAVLLSADRLRQVRAGDAPEATAHGYDDGRHFLEKFYPGHAGQGDATSGGRAPADEPNALSGRQE